MNILQVKGLKKTYTSFEIDGLNLTLPQGFIMGLVGRNGSGKTTLFKSIMNLIRLDGGTIQVMGHDSRTEEKLAKSHIAYVADTPTYPQDTTLIRLAEIAEAVYPAWEQAKFINLCTDLQLDIHTRFGAQSKGNQSKFDLIMALSQNASLILLDEPSAGLDPVSRQDILALLRSEMISGDRSVLYATHLTSDLDGIADYLTILEAGKIILTVSKDELDSSWRLIKLSSLPEALAGSPHILATLDQAWGVSMVTRDYETMSPNLPADAVIEHLKYGDLLIHLIKGVEQ